jgi:hypothetical protein
MIYTEGNAAYFIEKLGYMPTAQSISKTFMSLIQQIAASMLLLRRRQSRFVYESSVRGKLYSASIRQ